ncbi:hypothetical protein [Paenibacillus sp. FSL R10-2771]
MKYKKNTQAAVILKAILKNRKQTESQVSREERNIVPCLSASKMASRES